MVRKAETIGSLSELNVSNRTRAYLKKNFDSVDDVIKHGRYLAYKFDRVDSPKWESELISAVNEAGLVRPKKDFTKSLGVGRLYARVFFGNRECFIGHILQLSSEQYESFIGVSDEDIENVKVSIRDRLTELEYKVICLRCGLDGDEGRSPEAVAKYIQTTRERVLQIEAKATRKLARGNTLPVIFDAPVELSREIAELKSEFDEIHRNPIFKRERELLMELGIMRRLPLRYSSDTATVGRQISLRGLLDYTPIENLGLSLRTCSCLKRVGINTVSDILCYKGSWDKVRNLRDDDLREVIEKMHSIGYEDFEVKD